MKGIRVLEQRGRFSLEHDTSYGEGYFKIRRDAGDGGGMAQGQGRDEATARQAWAALFDGTPCRECGDPPFGSWMESCAKKMAERRLCFWCNHWTDALEKDAQDGPVVAVIDGRYYSIGESEASIGRRCGWRVEKGRLAGQYRHVLGHGGAEFSIAFHDGRKVTTTNLWAGGQIPAHFRDRLPDNARFERRAEHSAYVGVGSASEAVGSPIDIEVEA